MISPHLVIVADDLTGAADSAGRAVQAGLDAVILPAGGVEPTSDPTLARTIAISTDSRALPPDVAAKRVALAVAEATSWGPATWYKKIDSTLRGNLGAELAALVDTLGSATRVAICPAFPAQGRGLVDGYLVYAGVAPESVHLPSRLAEQTDLPVATIPLAVVREGPAALITALHAAADARLLVIDGTTDDDLATIVAAASELGWVLCGSAGMVAPLAAGLGGGPGEAVRSMHGEGPLLTVVGSGSAAAQAQVRAVTEAGCMRVCVAGPAWRGLDLLDAGSRPVGDWLLHLPAPEPGTVLEGAAARREAARLADLVVACVERLEPSDLLLVGGDTATFVLRGLGIERLDVVAELLPGIPLTEGTDARYIRRRIVLKPGNFGDEQVLVALWRFLRVDRREAV